MTIEHIFVSFVWITKHVISLCRSFAVRRPGCWYYDGLVCQHKILADSMVTTTVSRYMRIVYDICLLGLWAPELHSECSWESHRASPWIIIHFQRCGESDEVLILFSRKSLQTTHWPLLPFTSHSFVNSDSNSPKFLNIGNSMIRF